jgi:hypothetical protein
MLSVIMRNVVAPYEKVEVALIIFTSSQLHSFPQFRHLWDWLHDIQKNDTQGLDTQPNDNRAKLCDTLLGVILLSVILNTVILKSVILQCHFVAL